MGEIEFFDLKKNLKTINFSLINPDKIFFKEENRPSKGEGE